MTKKKVEVNEDVLKNIIVGDIPVFGREKTKEEVRNSRERKCLSLQNLPKPLQRKRLLQSPGKEKRKRVAIGKGIWSIFRHPTVPMSI